MKRLLFALVLMLALPGQTHLSAAPEAFRRGLEWLFARPD